MRVEEDKLVLEDVSELREVRSVLSNPTVRQIIRLLLETPHRLHVLQIARIIGKHKSTVSIALKKLYTLGIIEYDVELVHEGYNILEKYKFVRLRVKKIVFRGRELPIL